MSKFLFAFAVFASCVAHAEGNAFVVMHTEGPAPAEANLHADIQDVLRERGISVNLAPTAQELSTGLQAAACKSSSDVCAVAVGRALGGSRVIASRLDVLDGGFTAELALHDLVAGTIVRRTQKSASVDELRKWARIEALTFAGVPLRGRLTVSDLPAEAVVVIDGTDVVVMPMTKPLPLDVGEHQLEARLNDGPVHRQAFVIDAEHDVVIKLCATGADVRPCAATNAIEHDNTPLFVAGVSGIVVGALAAGVGLGANIYANTPHPDLDDPVGAFGTAKAVSLSGYIAGGAVLVAGAVAVAVAVVGE